MIFFTPTYPWGCRDVEVMFFIVVGDRAAALHPGYARTGIGGKNIMGYKEMTVIRVTLPPYHHL
jgi:hypothetical protein